jgi:hypothetical protein
VAGSLRAGGPAFVDPDFWGVIYFISGDRGQMSGLLRSRFGQGLRSQSGARFQALCRESGFVAERRIDARFDQQ